MYRIQRSVILSLLAFGVGAVASYHLVQPRSVRSAVGALAKKAQKRDIFLLVQQLEQKNQQVLKTSQGVEGGLAQARVRLKTLSSVSQALSRQIGWNNQLLATLQQQIPLNQALVASQGNLKSREGVTLNRDAMVGTNLVAISSRIGQSTQGMAALGATTAALQRELGLLRENMAVIVNELQKVSEGSQIPVIHQPITAINPARPLSSTKDVIHSLTQGLSSGSGPSSGSGGSGVLSPVINPIIGIGGL